MSDLADALLLSRGGTTRLVARMEAAGLVTREIPPDDRRATYAVLTPAGHAAAVAALPVQVELVHRTFHAFVEDEELRRSCASSTACCRPTRGRASRSPRRPPGSRRPPTRLPDGEPDAPPGGSRTHVGRLAPFPRAAVPATMPRQVVLPAPPLPETRRIAAMPDKTSMRKAVDSARRLQEEMAFDRILGEGRRGDEELTGLLVVPYPTLLGQRN